MGPVYSFGSYSAAEKFLLDSHVHGERLEFRSNGNGSLTGVVSYLHDESGQEFQEKIGTLDSLGDLFYVKAVSTKAREAQEKIKEKFPL
jgi:hypothetical protein